MGLYDQGLSQLPPFATSCTFADYHQNNHKWGDLWNGEDLSIFSLDDAILPSSATANTNGQKSINSSTFSIDQTSPSFSQSHSTEQSLVSPSNINQTLSTPSISLQPSNSPSDLTAKPGFRAAEAYVRPSPIATVGNLKSYGFDLRNATFTLTLVCDSVVTEETPTEVSLPTFHFPQDDIVVKVSSGKWTIGADDSDGGLIQKLRWWHGKGKQDLSVKGVRTRQGMARKGDEEDGYFAQCPDQPCSLM